MLRFAGHGARRFGVEFGDPVAVDCQPSGVFEKASVKAATKFKYKPRVVDGEAIEVAGVQNKFTYELEQ